MSGEELGCGKILNNKVCRLGALAGIALSLGLAPASGQAPKRPWLDPTLLAAAQKEGNLVVYSSTNEREGLAIFKLFTAATGINVQYVRGADNVLTSRMMIEFRGGQNSYDLVHMTAINRLPPAMLAQYEPPEAKQISASARDPDRRWYGVYPVYNTPAYNTKLVKPNEVPNSYEEMAQRKQWKGKVAIDGTDGEWLRGLVLHFGEQKGLQIAKDLAANLDPILTVGHLALSRSVGSGEYAMSINNYTNLDLNVKLGGAPIESFRARSGDAVLRVGRHQCEGRKSQRSPAGRQLHAQPGIAAVLHHVRAAADARRREAEPAQLARRHPQAQSRHRFDVGGRGKAVEQDIRSDIQAAVTLLRPRHQAERVCYWFEETRF